MKHAFLLFVFSIAAWAQSTNAPIDWQKAKQLHERRQRGESLTPDEQAYVRRALAERAGKGQRSTPAHLTPLCDMSATDKYEGEDGGLYGAGLNTPPETLRKAALAQLARVRPLNAGGQPDEAGTIGFVAISMSNATQEFSRFKQIADASTRKSAKVTIVDCAQGGQTMARWALPDAPAWREALRRLERAHVSPAQVQVAWIKLANAGPTGSLAEHTRQLERDTLAVLHNARAQFPNLRIAYLGSRIYAGYATTPLNPEPYAYEGAFVVRRLIQRQTQEPVLLWGPYLWADGERGRKLDKLVWQREDFAGDGTHPSDAGRRKVAQLLLDFLTTDPLAKSWFAKP